MDDHLEFIDALRFVYFDELHIDLKTEVMVTFFPRAQSCPIENIRRMFSNCAACVSNMWCQSCRRFHWLRLMEN